MPRKYSLGQVTRVRFRQQRVKNKKAAGILARSWRNRGYDVTVRYSPPGFVVTSYYYVRAR